MVFDPASGRIEPYLERALLQSFKGLNDLVFAANGDLYSTDQGQTGLHDPSGRLYRLRANGALDLLLDNLPSPNGLVLNRTENIVFLAVTRDNAIWRVPLMKNGLPSKVGVFIQLSGGGGPDGLAIDEDDNLAVCHVRLGSVWLFSAHGEPVLRVKSPALGRHLKFFRPALCMDSAGGGQALDRVHPGLCRSQELLDIPEAEREPEIHPDCALDDLGWELVARVGDGLHAPALSRNLLRRPLRVTTPAGGSTTATQACPAPS